MVFVILCQRSMSTFLLGVTFSIVTDLSTPPVEDKPPKAIPSSSVFLM